MSDRAAAASISAGEPTAGPDLRRFPTTDICVSIHAIRSAYWPPAEGPTRRASNLQRFSLRLARSASPDDQFATMIFSLFPRSRQETTIRTLYGAIVAQARTPFLYSGYDVPDTVNGRFDMIVLHLALFLDRMEAGTAPMRALGQAVFDLFCREMDGHFREAGISDLKVPKEMQQMAEAFYGRRSVYREALAALDNVALEAALMRNVYVAQPKANAALLAAYVRAAAESLSRAAGFERGQLAWPDPAAHISQ